MQTGKGTLVHRNGRRKKGYGTVVDQSNENGVPGRTNQHYA